MLRESRNRIAGRQIGFQDWRRRRQRWRGRGLQGRRDPASAVVLPRRRILHPRCARVHFPRAARLGQRRHRHDEDHRKVVRVRLGVDEAFHSLRSGDDVIGLKVIFTKALLLSTGTSYIWHSEDIIGSLYLSIE